MQKSTNKPFAEQLQSTLSAEERKEHKENYSNDQLTSFENIPTTPFMVTGNPEKGYFAIMGKYRITAEMKSQADVIEYVHAQPWELLITVISAVFDVIKDIKAGEENTTKQPTLFGYNEGYDDPVNQDGH